MTITKDFYYSKIKEANYLKENEFHLFKKINEQIFQKIGFNPPQVCPPEDEYDDILIYFCWSREEFYAHVDIMKDLQVTYFFMDRVADEYFDMSADDFCDKLNEAINK